MPIQIDRMDTSIELTSPSAGASPAAAPGAAARDGSPSREALKEVVMQIFDDELDRYARMRGH